MCVLVWYVSSCASCLSVSASHHQSVSSRLSACRPGRPSLTPIPVRHFTQAGRYGADSKHMQQQQQQRCSPRRVGCVCWWCTSVCCYHCQSERSLESLGRRAASSFFASFSCCCCFTASRAPAALGLPACPATARASPTCTTRPACVPASLLSAACARLGGASLPLFCRWCYGGPAAGAHGRPPAAAPACHASPGHKRHGGNV